MKVTIEELRRALDLAKNQLNPSGWAAVDMAIQYRNVTFEELGISEREFEELGHRIDVAETKKQLEFARTQLVRTSWVRVDITVRDMGKVTFEELGTTKEEFEELGRRINASM